MAASPFGVGGKVMEPSIFCSTLVLTMVIGIVSYFVKKVT
jgi:hypothetical protein